MPRFLPVLLALVAGLSACRNEPAPDREPTPSPQPVVFDTLHRAAPPDSGRDAPPVEIAEDRPIVFDTTEPPETVVEIPPPRPPAPRPPPPAPLPPPPPPVPTGPSGSCDVRDTERYCFTYTGAGWSPAAAARHCGMAPEARFRSGPCPTVGRIATCTFRRPSEPEREIVYTYYAPYDVALAELACPGTFERQD